MDNFTSNDFLTQFLLTFEAACDLGVTRITPYAWYILGALGTIEIALSAALNFDQDQIKLLLRNFLKIGAIAYFVKYWSDWCRWIFKGFQMFGVIAGTGDTTATADSIGAMPSAIAAKGIYLFAGISNEIQNRYAGMFLANMGDLLLKLFVILAIVFCFFWIAIQLFIVILEFKITTVVTIILIPFGVFQHTKFLFEKAVGAIFSFAVKVMTMMFILSIGVPIMTNWALAQDADITAMLAALVGSAAMAFLCWQAPAVVQGLLSGSPSLGIGHAVGGAMAAVGAANTVTGGAMKTAGVVIQASKANSEGGSTGFKHTMGNLSRMALQDTSFMQGRREAKNLISENTSSALRNNAPLRGQKPDNEKG